METEKIIEAANEMAKIASSLQESDTYKYRGILARAKHFLTHYAGDGRAFLEEIADDKLHMNRQSAGKQISGVLKAFVDHMEAGLINDLSPKRQAEIDVTSDFLDQANGLLMSSKVHPAAPAVLIGASLEEFLRNWVEDEQLSMENKKPGIETYATTLREAELITKQDVKDISAWGGLRNHAAHGEWDQLGGKDSVRLMLNGVNLFMRKYSIG